MRDFPCNISKCILEVIDFNCSFSGNVSYTDFKEILSFGNTRDKEDKCIGKCVDHDFFSIENYLYCAKIRIHISGCRTCYQCCPKLKLCRYWKFSGNGWFGCGATSQEI